LFKWQGSTLPFIFNINLIQLKLDTNYIILYFFLSILYVLTPTKKATPNLIISEKIPRNIVTLDEKLRLEFARLVNIAATIPAIIANEINAKIIEVIITKIFFIWIILD